MEVVVGNRNLLSVKKSFTALEDRLYSELRVLLKNCLKEIEKSSE